MLEFAEKTQKKQSGNQSTKQVNHTGIPTQLKERMEQSTGLSMDDVRVHYNSYLPEKLDALAYTCGNQVEISPGQEHCLPHELGHVVQQKLGLVRANAMHASGVAMNTEDALENQADEIGAGKYLDIAARPTIRNIIQRKLFIRKLRDIVFKDSDEMRAKLGEKKVPNKVTKDLGYLEIYETSSAKLAESFMVWLGKKTQKTLEGEQGEAIKKKIIEKIGIMINKQVDSADPKTVYDKHIGKKNNVTRPPENVHNEVSYYFDSIEEFFNYLFLYLNKSKIQEGEAYTESDELTELDDWLEDDNESIDADVVDSWLKINVVNTGAGDAIVMTLPAGYLIVDLGSNLNILLNYLALRQDKHARKRGISLVGDKTRIVITHGDTDHMGCSRRQFSFGDDKLLEQVIIGYMKYDGTRDAQDDKYIQLVKLLKSGMFHVCDIPKTEEGNKNCDSIVIARRLEDSEAVILCGDQEPRNLVEVLKKISKFENKTAHMFVKVPHHGSCQNNSMEVLDNFSQIGNKADFVISAGNLYNHPTAGMFANGPQLYYQGTEVRYPAEMSTESTELSSSNPISMSRLFYTQNLNGEYGIIPGSVVYKSNGIDHATYSKCYTDIFKGQEEDEIQMQKNIQQIEFMTENIGEDQNQISKDICNQFMKLSEGEKVYYLSELKEPAKINKLLNSMNIQGLSFYHSDLWEELFVATWEHIDWGQNYFNIVAMTCSDDFLDKLYGNIQYMENEVLRDRLIHAVIDYNREVKEYVAKDFVMDALEVNEEREKLDSENTINILCDYFCHQLLSEIDIAEDDIWDKVEPKTQIGVLKSLVEQDVLSFEQIDTVLQLLIDAVEELEDEESDEFILSIFDSDFFLDLVHRFPEYYQDMYDIYKDKYAGRENMCVWYDIKTNRNGKDLMTYMNEFDMEYDEYILHLDPETFSEDMEILLPIALDQINDNPGYLGGFINICYIYKYKELPRVLNSLPKNLSCLCNLLERGNLNPPVITACCDYLFKNGSDILEAAEDEPVELVNRFPFVARAIILTPPDKETEEITNFTNIKISLYMAILEENQKLMKDILGQHLAVSKKEAENILFEIIGNDSSILDMDTLFTIAYEERNTDKQYLAALFEICNDHGDLDTLKEYLEKMLKDNQLECLYQLLTEGCLEQKVVEVCVNLLTDNIEIWKFVSDNLTWVHDHYPLLLKVMLLKPLNLEIIEERTWLMECKKQLIQSLNECYPEQLNTFKEIYGDDMEVEIKQ